MFRGEKAEPDVNVACRFLRQAITKQSSDVVLRVQLSRKLIKLLFLSAFY